MARPTDSLHRGLVEAVRFARALATLGPSTALAVADNSVRMALGERTRRRGWRARSSAAPRGPGRLLSVEPLAVGRGGAARKRRMTVGACFRFTGAELEVRFLADDVVRVSWGPDEPPLPWALVPAAGGILGAARQPDGPGEPDQPVGPGEPDPPVEPDGPDAGAAGAAGVAAGVAAGPSAGHLPLPSRSIEVLHAPHALVRSRALGVRVLADGTIEYLAAGGQLVRRELPPLRRGASRVHRHVLRPGERVSGLGEQSEAGSLEGVHRLWNRDPGGSWGPAGSDPLYCVVPVLVGLHRDEGVLAFYENPHEGVVRVAGEQPTASGRVEVELAGGMLRHYVTAGTLAHLVERYTWLTGRPAMPPRWALGYHQSRWGYRTEQDVREVADGFAAEGLPLSAVHLDIDYMRGYRVFTVDAERFPDLARLSADLLDRGTRLVTIVDPGVKVDESYPLYVEGLRHERYVRNADGTPHRGVVWPGPAVFPDFTDPETRSWWAEQYHTLLDAGVAGVWHDMNEPTSIGVGGDQTLPRTARHVAEGRFGEHRECHNVYGLLMDAAGATALAQARPHRRPFVLSRAGWAGVQRWAWNWTGDAATSWESMRQQVPTLVGLGLSGVAFCGPDVGGFSGTPSAELYLRWLELSVLLPLCRTHSVVSVPGREPWRFPEPYRSAIGELIRFRYRILPYLYSLAAEAASTGWPLVRPPRWPSADPTGTADTFLLGDALLVAPVVVPGAVERDVDLPPGGWLRWTPPAEGRARGAPAPRRNPTHEERAHEGPPEARAPSDVLTTGRAVAPRADGRASAPLGRAPLFVRAGSVLPLDDGVPDGAGGAGHEPGLLAFHCFPDPSGAARGWCYDDAGDGDGPWRRDRLELVPGAGGLRTLRWSREGAYPRPERVRVVVHGKAAVSASADGAPVLARTVSYRGGAATVIDCAPFDVLELV